MKQKRLLMLCPDVMILRLTEMEILYKKEKEEADQLLEQQRLVRLILYTLRLRCTKKD